MSETTIDGPRNRPVDHDERVRITQTELDRTLFVEAGAGSGKTTQLVERVVGLVLDHGVRLASVAAITFTEAAASELAERVRVAFEQEEARALLEGESERAARCHEAVGDADAAAITTLHGFARRILSEHPVEAGLPPRLEILDEINSQLERESRWERFVDAVHDDPANEELLLRAVIVGAPIEPKYSGQASMKDVAVELGQNWDRLDAIIDRGVDAFAPIDFSDFDAAVDALEAVVGECVDVDDARFRLITEKHLPEMRAIRAIADPHLELRAMKGRKWGPGNSGKGAAWSIDVKDVKERIRDVGSARDAVIDEIANDVLRRLLTIVGREVRDAAEQRRVEGRLEFHDLLVLARRLVQTSDVARDALHRRYTHLLLDEFQDTDPIQIELAVLIAATVSGTPPASWDDAEVEPGRLFFVGDPKQSIYRFRRADIGLFLQAREQFGPAGSWLRLTTNFRTVSPVVEWVNELFGSLMADEIAGSQPRYEPLSAHRSASSIADHRPLLMGGPHEGMRAPQLRVEEARDVAAVICDIAANPESWPIDAGGEWRPATLSDVTILVPTRTSLPQLRAALDAAKVAYRLDTGTLVYGTQEVRDVLAAVRAIDDPTDRLSLVAALRSPLYACSDRDLFSFHAAGGRWDVRAEPPESVPSGHPVAMALEHLRAMWESRWWSGPSEIVDRIVRDRRAQVLAFAEGRPREVWRRLRFLVDQAQAFEDAGGSGLRGFVDWAELQQSESSRVHEPMLPELDEQSVRIMTIHGSKGLEFPITILSGMTTQPPSKRRGVSLLWGPDDVPEVKLSSEISTLDHDPRADIEAAMNGDERKRLLYVACTRARDHLIVACHHKPKIDSFGAVIWRELHESDSSRAVESFADGGPVLGGAVDPSAGDVVDLRRGAGMASTAPFPPSIGEWMSDRRAFLDAREALIGPQRISSTVSATAIAHDVAAAVVDAELDDWSPEDDDGFASVSVGASSDGDVVDAVAPEVGRVRRRGRRGTAVGRAVHATLEFIDLSAPPAGRDEAVAALAVRCARAEDIAPEAATVESLVRSALASDAIRLAASSVHHKEVYVSAPLGARVIEGYIDLLIETPDGLVVVDYKTDSATTDAQVDAKVAAYEMQGAAYAVALEVATGAAVAECRFVFCSSRGAIERTVRDLDAVKRRVLAHLGVEAPR